jgi:metal transporter CNNM
MAMTPERTATTIGRPTINGYASTRPAVIGLAKILFLGLSQLSFATAAPLKKFLHITEEEHHGTEEPSLWLYLSTAVVLVLLGGAFAGLTIA